MPNNTSKESLGNDEESPAAMLMAFARLIDQNAISSDRLADYIESMLSVHLAEPSALCRKAAMRLSTFDPPLEPHALATRLWQLAHEIEIRDIAEKPVSENNQRPVTPAQSILRWIGRRFRRFWSRR
jgi:hypothetical protein